MSDDGLLFSHEELIKITKQAVNQLITNNGTLKNLPFDVTLDEINAQIAVEYGQSMTVFVQRGDGEEIPVIVKQGVSRVMDLKRALKQHMTLKFQRSGENAKISWRHIWRTHWLSFNGVKLIDDKEFLQKYGIVNKSVLMFVKKMKYDTVKE